MKRHLRLEAEKLKLGRVDPLSFKPEEELSYSD